MALTKSLLGSYLELRENYNSELKYGLDDVRGVNNLKKLMPTKADLNGRDISKFNIVYPGEFVFNHRTSRNGSKFSIAYNDEEKPIICTEDYVVFKIRDDCKNKLHELWLYMFFNRPEFDRYVITNSWGSSTEFYNWDDIKSIKLEIPSFEVQQKYVDVYNSMLANQKSYERGLEDLKLTCDATIEDFKRKYPCEKISKYIHEENLRNTNEVLKEVLGVCKDKVFIPTIANMEGISLENYKIVKPNWFAYSNRINIGSIALKYDTPCLVSPSYTVFSVDETKMYPEYLSLWLQREEFCHFAFYYSLGTVKDELDMTELGQMNIPFPSLEIQNNIITIYKNYLERKELNEKLKSQIKSICPILIKGSIEEAMREA